MSFFFPCFFFVTNYINEFLNAYSNYIFMIYIFLYYDNGYLLYVHHSLESLAWVSLVCEELYRNYYIVIILNKYNLLALIVISFTLSISHFFVCW